MNVLSVAMPRRAWYSEHHGCNAALGTAFEGSPEAFIDSKAARKPSIEMPAHSLAVASDANARNLPRGASRD
eukprot:2715786-Alexandrium_andersonii.AAC.1